MTSTIESPTQTTDVVVTDDTAEAGAVAERLVQIFNDGGIAVLTSIGHQLGLFETLATLPPATSRQVADAAGLDERYVREWLGGVVTAGFVEYDPAPQTYSLCPVHAPFLTGATPDNIARSMPYITLMGEAVPKLLPAFRNGGGLVYADYPSFHHVQAEESIPVMDALLVDSIVPLAGVEDRLRAGIEVADIGCGQGHAVNLLAQAFPASRFTGFDFEEDAIAAARAEAEAWGLTNVAFVVCDVAGPAEPAAYDLVTAFDVIHDQAHPGRVVANIHESLRPGGTLIVGEIDAHSTLEDNLDLPWASLLYAISIVHCMSVSLGQGGEGLGTVWGRERAEEMLRASGFSDVVAHRLEDNPFNVYFVARA